MLRLGNDICRVIFGKEGETYSKFRGMEVYAKLNWIYKHYHDKQ